jgi:hypothetical protein
MSINAQVLVRLIEIVDTKNKQHGRY